VVVAASALQGLVRVASRHWKYEASVGAHISGLWVLFFLQVDPVLHSLMMAFTPSEALPEDSFTL